MNKNNKEDYNWCEDESVLVNLVEEIEEIASVEFTDDDVKKICKVIDSHIKYREGNQRFQFILFFCFVVFLILLNIFL